MDVAPINCYAPFVDRLKPIDRAYEGRLSRTRRSTDYNYLSFPDGFLNPVQSPIGAIPLFNVLKRNHLCAHCNGRIDVRCSPLTTCLYAPLQTSHGLPQRPADHEICDREDRVDLEWLGQQLNVDLICGIRQFVETDDVAKRRVLNKAYEPIQDAWKHVE